MIKIIYTYILGAWIMQGYLVHSPAWEFMDKDTQAHKIYAWPYTLGEVLHDIRFNEER